jgi:hypothetical protein
MQCYLPSDKQIVTPDAYAANLKPDEIFTQLAEAPVIRKSFPLYAERAHPNLIFRFRRTQRLRPRPFQSPFRAEITRTILRMTNWPVAKHSHSHYRMP